MEEYLEISYKVDRYGGGTYATLQDFRKLTVSNRALQIKYVMPQFLKDLIRINGIKVYHNTLGDYVELDDLNGILSEKINKRNELFTRIGSTEAHKKYFNNLRDLAIKILKNQGEKIDVDKEDNSDIEELRNEATALSEEADEISFFRDTIIGAVRMYSALNNAYETNQFVSPGDIRLYIKKEEPYTL